MSLHISLIVALSLCGLPLCAHPWEALHELKASDRIEVFDDSGAEHKGVFKAVSADAISLTTRLQEVAIE